jgi:hypothetical protein
MPLGGVVPAAVPVPAAPERSLTGDVGPVCVGGMAVYTFSHCEKTAFLAAGAKIILEEPGAREVMAKHHRLVEATIMVLSGTAVWPANMRVVYTSVPTTAGHPVRKYNLNSSETYSLNLIPSYVQGRGCSSYSQCKDHQRHGGGRRYEVRNKI